MWYHCKYPSHVLLRSGTTLFRYSCVVQWLLEESSGGVVVLTKHLRYVYTGGDRQRDWRATCCSATCCAAIAFTRLLHIIHVSAVSVVGVLQEKCSRQPVPRGNYKFKLKVRLHGTRQAARLARDMLQHICGAAVAPQSRCLSRPV